MCWVAKARNRPPILPSTSPVRITIMAKKIISEDKVEIAEVKLDSQLARLIEVYKTTNPKKYEQKKAELEAKLKANK